MEGMKDCVSRIFAIGMVRRFVLPALLAAIVGWLLANNFDDSATAICAGSDTLGIYVEECNSDA